MTTFNLLQAVCDNHTKRLICSEFVKKGINPEIAIYIYDGIGKDIEENWTEEKFSLWVDFGVSLYGMTMEHHSMVGAYTRICGNFIKAKGVPAFLKMTSL